MAQTVSYEVSITIIILHSVFFFYFELLRPKTIPLRVFLFLTMLLLFVSALAETNRAPFDFSEGESELVSGFNTEFRSVSFLLIFLAEYMSILFMATLVALLYDMTTYIDLFAFLLFWAFLFVWRRGTLPRIRYDQLIYLAWKNFLPAVLASAGTLIIL